jgi:hypothetical protein
VKGCDSDAYLRIALRCVREWVRVVPKDGRRAGENLPAQMREGRPAGFSPAGSGLAFGDPGFYVTDSGAASAGLRPRRSRARPPAARAAPAPAARRLIPCRRNPSFFASTAARRLGATTRMSPVAEVLRLRARPSRGFTGDTAAFPGRMPCPAAMPCSPALRARGPERARRNREGADPLPWWVFLLSFLTLGLVAALILSLR